MVKVNLNGMTDLDMLDSSLTINLVVKAPIHGAMVAATLVTGKQIRCMDMEFSTGKTVKHMRVNLLTITKRAMECLAGPMVAGMTGNGEMVNRMA